MILPLAANGGLTPTHGLRLSPVSPAIDRGNTALTVDQRGLRRPVDFPPVDAANGSDIGAFEAQISATAADVTIGGIVRNSAGRGVSGSVVTLTDTSGNARHARTNPFGYFRFLEVPSGATYIISANYKIRLTDTQIINLNGDMTDIVLQEQP